MSKPTSAADEAAHWFLQLQEESADAETFMEWQKWMSASSAHRTAYVQIEVTSLRLSRSAAKPPLPSAAELADDSYDGSQSIAEWRQAAASRVRPETRGIQASRWLSMAAGIAAVSLVGMWLWMQNASDVEVGTFTYRTPAGQRQAIDLPDGSKITLDANSELDVRLQPQTRSMTLRRGEAFFKVAHDKARPFVVRTGSTQVTALGTAFNVRLSGNRTVVAVTEGKVEVLTASGVADVMDEASAVRKPAAPRLRAQVSAGEAVSYVDDGNLQALPATEAPIATAWLEGRRQYRNEPLRYVLADVDRYTGRRILVTGEASDLRFTGTLDLQNSDAWLRGLPVALPVTLTTREDGSLSVEMRVKPVLSK